MEYQVSALKWRPQKFGELVGQEHIVRTLGNAIRLDRVAHAYLFSGTRGVGKTTTARIFAKALNCKNASAAEPCGECAFCVEIRQGNCVDVLEIDGASNNGVAEVRDLIGNARYATAACKYKIYIIDEVHMLSKSAFNALLKTLEEPPRQVVFMFATTELSKIPETILSRCQCFEFKPLTHKQVIEQLDLICRQEGIRIDGRGLEQIAKIGGGSMRDSQTLLDQIIAYGGKEIGVDAVESVLGVVACDVLENFVERLATRDAAGLIALIHEIANSGKDLSYFCRDLIEYVRDLLFTKIAQKPETLLDARLRNLKILKEQAEKFHADELHQMFSVLSHAEGHMKRASAPQMIFEMAVLRLTDVRPFRDIDTLIEKINRMEPTLTAATDGPLPGENRPDEPVRSAPVSARPKADSVSGGGPSAAEGFVSDTPPDAGSGPSAVISSSPQDVATHADANALWEAVKKEISTLKPRFLHYLEGCQVELLSPTHMRLAFDPITLNLASKEENLKTIEETVRKVYKKDIVLELVKTGYTVGTRLAASSKEAPFEGKPVVGKKPPPPVNAGEKYQSNSQIVQDALDIFGGTVIR